MNDQQPKTSDAVLSAAEAYTAQLIQAQISNQQNLHPLLRAIPSGERVTLHMTDGATLEGYESTPPELSAMGMVMLKTQGLTRSRTFLTCRACDILRVEYTDYSECS